MALDVGVDGIGSGLALLLGEYGLFFKKRGQELVGILKRAECQDSHCVDLVQHRDFKPRGIARPSPASEVALATPAERITLADLR